MYVRKIDLGSDLFLPTPPEFRASFVALAGIEDVHENAQCDGS